jgi:hypothetical protein
VRASPPPDENLFERIQRQAIAAAVEAQVREARRSRQEPAKPDPTADSIVGSTNSAAL